MSHSKAIQSLKRDITSIFGANAATRHITPAKVAKARSFIAQANQAIEIVTPYAGDLIKSWGLDPDTDIIEGEAKHLHRIFEKAIGKHDGDLEQVNDVGRIRIPIRSPEDVENIREYFLGRHSQYTQAEDCNDARMGKIINNAFPTNNIEVVEFEDFFYVPSKNGRVGIHITLNVELPGGKKMPFEIQIIHEQMLTTEELTRSNYLKSQEIERIAHSEGRMMSLKERTEQEGYLTSNREAYLADRSRLDLNRTARPDIAAKTEFKSTGLVLVA